MRAGDRIRGKNGLRTRRDQTDTSVCSVHSEDAACQDKTKQASARSRRRPWDDADIVVDIVLSQSLSTLVDEASLLERMLGEEIAAIFEDRK